MEQKQYNSIPHLAHVDALGSSKLVTEMAKATAGAAAAAAGASPPAPTSARSAVSTSPAPLTEDISLRRPRAARNTVRGMLVCLQQSFTRWT